MKRRELIKNLSILPLSGAIIGTTIPFESIVASPVSPPVPKRDIFKELGIRTFINAAGTYTAMSGSLMHDEVVDVIRSSSEEFAMIDEVQEKVGAKIAAICHAEDATVTAGCWSALVLGTAGVLTGTDMKKVAQLPNLEGIDRKSVV